LLVGVCGAVVSLIIGTLWGSVAAYLGGRWDAIMMRFVDVLYAMPSIIFVIVLMAAYDGAASSFVEGGLRRFGVDDVSEGASIIRLLLLYLGLGAVSWLTVARIVRGEVLALRERTYVLASQVLGASTIRILSRHILPNLFGVLIVYLTLTIPTIILYESFLSFLGMGIQPPYGSLGSLIAEGALQINPIRIYWWMIVFPGAALVTALLALNFVGDGLRNLFNLQTSDRDD
jgi:peptide/nickel transport system permease protein/oligopeptide transport system permease protein